jgi:integrase
VASGARADRVQLRKAIGVLQAGDVLMVTRLDRLARSTRDLLNTLAAITGSKAAFRSLGDAWADTTTAHGPAAVTDDHVFLSAGNRRIASSMVNYTFRRVLRLAGVAPGRTRPCRIHDLRHTFATRSLQQCSARRESVARHFVALATYMGHTDIVHTYWYLEATRRRPHPRQSGRMPR